MSAVLQPWVQELPWKMQSVLIAGSRGPDSSAGGELKKFTRWIRRETQQNADPEHAYMNVVEDPHIDEKVLLQEIEYGVTWHYFGHLLHALEIIAYKGHNGLDQGVKIGNMRTKFATYWYITLVQFMHLGWEDEKLMDDRLKDMVDHE
jgi:hypothetical protein